MRHPFFNITRLSLKEGESDFHPLEGREGLIVTLGPKTSFFDRPGRSVSRWPGTVTIPYRSPHPATPRSRLMNELSVFMRILCGGGDVKLNMIRTLSRQREILLTAGEGNVLEKINVTDLMKNGAPPLLFLQPAYLCSSANVEIRSILCDVSSMSWARAPYVYRARPVSDPSEPAILCLSGRTMIWSERLEPGESRDFSLGNVLAVTTNVTCKLRPTSVCRPDDYKATVRDNEQPESEQQVSSVEDSTSGNIVLESVRGLAAAMRIFFNSIRMREGFFVCELTNHSTKPAYAYVQINRGGFYGGSGLIGLAIRIVSSFVRWFHLPMEYH